MSNPQMLATYMTQIATKAAADAVAAERREWRVEYNIFTSKLM